MSCIIVTLHVPTKFQNTRCAHAAVNRTVFFHMLFDFERVVPIAIIQRKVSVNKLKSPSRLSTNYRNTAFVLFEAGTRVADVPHSFGCNGRTIYHFQTRFRHFGSKNDKLPSGIPLITTPLEVRVILGST